MKEQEQEEKTSPSASVSVSVPERSDRALKKKIEIPTFSPALQQALNKANPRYSTN
jgi:hypothetical protein